MHRSKPNEDKIENRVNRKIDQDVLEVVISHNAMKNHYILVFDVKIS